MLRTCPHCNEVATTYDDLTRFVKDNGSKFGRRNVCISYRRLQFNTYDTNNRESRNVAAEKRYKTDSTTKKRATDRLRMTRYGMSFEQYEAMKKIQNHCCAICKTHESEFSRQLSVDHCHITGVIRGLLCLNCNTGIGKLGDNNVMLRKAINYLEKT